MMLLLKIVVGALALYAVVAIGAYYLQRKLMYFPDRERVPPASVGLRAVEEIELAASDGNRVIAWWGRAQAGQPTILYFHGNGGSLACRADTVARFLDSGRGIFMMTYRGFGGSSGEPSEKANVADAKLAYDTLVRSGADPQDIIVYGESIGTGVAIQVAAEKDVAGVILDAPYTSILDVAIRHYPYLPVRTFLTDRYDTMAFVGAVSAPVLIIHGEADQVIPVEMGRAVHAALKTTKKIATFPGAGHTDHSLFGSDDVVDAWIDGVRQQPKKKSSG